MEKALGMKYSRTKMGKIYDLINLRVEEKLNGNPYVETSSGWVIYKSSVVKQADTIEELCDDFVIIDALKNHIVVRKDNEVEQHWLKYHDTDCVVVYGAVWTDKGLIYVAKMNDKGELELL